MQNGRAPHFIEAPTTEGCPCFMKMFQAKRIRSAVLKITGLGLYRAFLNGERIGEDWLTPGCNDYDAYLRYQTYEVTSLLREGENCLQVVTGDGWYKGAFGLERQEEIWGDRYLLAAQLDLCCEDGSADVVETDESWLAGESCVRKSGIYDGEVRDDMIQTAKWQPCKRAAVKFSLEEDKGCRVRCKEVRKASLYVSPKGEQILDFGQNMAGVVRFYNRLPRGRSVRLQFGEILQNDCFYRDNLRMAKAEYVYTSDGAEKWVEPWFTYFGFRYVKVEEITKEGSGGRLCPDSDDFQALVLSSDLRETLSVRTDSPKINRLMENTLWSQRSNFVDVPTDCPQRDERLGWTADTQVFAETACYQMDCKEFYRKYLRDLRVDQTRYFSGDIPAFSPSLKGSGIPGGAVWADAATILPWKVYENYGDKALLEENYPLMRDYTELLIRRDEEHGNRHLVEWGFTFGDWLALDGKSPDSPLGGTDNTYIRTIYYWNSVRLTALAAGVLERQEDSDRYTELAGNIRETILNEYLTPSGHLWRDTQTAYVLALYYGLFRDRDVMIRDFRERMRQDDFSLKCGFTGTPLLLPVLLDCGLEDEAFRFLYNEEYPGWLYQVNLGATTIWERWNSMLPDKRVSDTGMNSFNHYAYGSVCGALYSRVAGLRVETPGWKSAVIEPHFHWRMRRMDLRFDSPMGEYAVAWRITEDNQAQVSARVPQGASALIRLPGRKEFRVEGGDYCWNCSPGKDFRQTFSLETPVADLMGHPEAKKALLETLPFMETLAVPGSEMWVRGMRELPALNPNFAGLDLSVLEKKLREVKIF